MLTPETVEKLMVMAFEKREKLIDLMLEEKAKA